MQITRQTVSGVEVFTAQGQLDATTSPQLETELLAGVQTGATQFVVDLEHVSLISSAALRVFLSMAKRMRRQHGKILLCAPSAEVNKVFEVSDLSSQFDIYSTQADALAATGGVDPAAKPGSPSASSPPAPVPPVPPAFAPTAAPVPATPPAPVVPTPLPSETAAKPPPPPPQHVPPARVTAAVPPPAAAAAPPGSDPSTEDNGGETLVATGALQSQVALAVSAARALVPATPAPPPAAMVPPRQLPPPPPAPAAPPVTPASRPVAAPVAPPPLPLPAAAPLPKPTPPPAAPPRPAPVVPSEPVTIATKPLPPLPPPPVPPAAPPRPTAPPAAPASAGPSRRPQLLVPMIALGVCILGIFAGGTYLWKSLGGSPKGSSGTNPAISSPTPGSTPAPATPTSASTPSPRPTPKTDPVVSTSTPRAPTPEPSAVATPPAGEEAARIVAPARLDLDPTRQENQDVRASVLKRIELMPVSPRVKDQLYAAVDRARRMGKVITITFGRGRTELSGSDVEKLRQAFQQPSVQELVNDPTLVFVVLGYADTRGNEQSNQQISERRARETLKVMRSSCGLLNTMHSIGMGGSDLFDKQSAERNRAVEIWAVLP